MIIYHGLLFVSILRCVMKILRGRTGWGLSDLDSVVGQVFNVLWLSLGHVLVSNVQSS
jgi:hypothetical protein